MLWPREEFHAAYGQIKHDALQSGGSSVLVLVALDVDALCASAILTRLLKADFVSYALLPVRGYEDIVRIRDARIAKAGSELRSVVMVNCGAIVNVAALLQLPPQAKCYIFDSHRPIHLANIYDAEQQIVVFDDGAQAIEEFPADGSDIERDEFEDSEEEGDEEEEEEEDDDGDEAEEEEVDEDDGEQEVEFGDAVEPTEETEENADGEASAPHSPSASADDGENEKKRKRAQDGDSDADGEMEEGDKLLDDGDKGDDEDEDMEESTPKKHKSDGVQEADAVDEIDPNDKVAKRRRREEILRYYRGSFHGAPAASIAFELAQQMNAGANRDLLWFAIVGLTKQFIMEEIDTDNYNLMVHRFQDEVLALDASAAGGATDDDQAVANPAYEHGRISFEEEYRFMCYRHWSLYESMYYSDYIAAKLGLYMDQARRFGARNASTDGSDGETTLHVFLARMGFSLRQSQQKFTYMPLEMKRQLRDKIQEMAPEFGLDDVFYGSFKRQFAFQYLLGAADAVHGLQALLEAPEAYISSVFQAENHNQKGVLQQPVSSAYNIDSKGIAKAIAKDGDDAGEEPLDEDLRDFKHQNFFLASTALSCRSVSSSALMESGIKVAMELKQAIVRVGISIMERKLIVRVKHFRYVCLNIPEREQELFANANVLTQLALFLLTVHRTSGKWGAVLPAPKKRKPNGDGGGDEDDEDEAEIVGQQKPIVPLVLITRNPAQNCFLVVGITCPNNPGEVHRNTLGTAFRLAAGETGANFRQDGFSSAVLEIQMDDIQYFVEQLHNVMDA